MTMHTTVYWSLCLVGATALVVNEGRAAGAAPRQANGPLEERVAAVVKAEVLAKGVPSLSVAVMRDGQTLLQKAWGLADVDGKKQADASTTYPIASVSKQFTAALVLEQVDRGRVSLSDPIGKHLPGLRQEYASLPIEQILNHTSGLPNDFRDPERRLEDTSVERMLAMVNQTTLANPPGTKYVYSNTGYFLLAVLAERLYGKPFGTALRDDLAVPLGLGLAPCADPKPGEAVGYRRVPDGTLAPPPGLHHSLLLGAGGVCATAGDLVKWTHALHTGKVLSPATYKAMITPKGAAAKANYGLGLAVRSTSWGTAIAHGGQSQTGHTADLQWYPEESLAIALLYNAAPRVPNIDDLIARAVMGVPLQETPK
jgi:D-alanyl-D-alanine carboxypeptidase